MTDTQEAIEDWKICKQGWDEDKIDVTGAMITHHYETIRQALKLADAVEWKTIESAPMSNGSKTFMAYVPGHGCLVCFRWDDNIHSNGKSKRLIKSATHWKPLPEPPKSHIAALGE